MPVSSFAGVIFDLDGTLADSEPWIMRATSQMLREQYGITVNIPGDFRPFFGTGEEKLITGVAGRHGVNLTMPRDKERVYDLYLELIRGQMKPVNGAVEFVHACRAAGLKTAIASSGDDRKVQANLQQIGLPPDQFTIVVTGSGVKQKKPDPEIFLLAAKRLGLSPAQCLIVEDATSGVQAAKAAGSECLAVTTSFDEAALRGVGADFIATDFTQVPTDVRAALGLKR